MEKLWTVARFPNGSWTTGGQTNDPDYAECEVFTIFAASRDEAKKKAQARRLNEKRRKANNQAAQAKGED